MQRIEFLRDIVAKRKAKRVQALGVRMIIDVFTAATIIEVYEKLNRSNREEFIKRPWNEILDVTWQLHRRHRAN